MEHFDVRRRSPTFSMFSSKQFVPKLDVSIPFGRLTLSFSKPD
jgi:hypothetical protein